MSKGDSGPKGPYEGFYHRPSGMVPEGGSPEKLVSLFAASMFLSIACGVYLGFIIFGAFRKSQAQSLPEFVTEVCIASFVSALLAYPGLGKLAFGLGWPKSRVLRSFLLLVGSGLVLLAVVPQIFLTNLALKGIRDYGVPASLLSLKWKLVKDRAEEMKETSATTQGS